MDLRNCPHCGKLFAYDGSYKLCNVCRNDEEEDFQKVKNYLWDNPNATIEEVHIETDVKREMIIKFVHDGRLLADGINFNFMLECDRCGKSIVSGKYCSKCQQDLINGFSKTAKRSKENDKEKKNDKTIKDRMFTTERIKKRNS